MPVRVLIAVLMLAGATVARVCPCACGHAHPVEPTPAEDGGDQPVSPDHDPHCPCATGLAVEPAVVPQVEPLSDAPSALPDSAGPPGWHTNRPRQQPESRPPVRPLPLYLTLLTLRN